MAAERSNRVLEEEIRQLKKQIRENARSDDRIWFDSDQKLWFSHRCLGKKVDTPLPEKWRVSSTGEVTPSVMCLLCGAHFNAKINMSLQYIEGYVPWSKPWYTKPAPERGKEREDKGWAKLPAF